MRQRISRRPSSLRLHRTRAAKAAGRLVLRMAAVLAGLYLTLALVQFLAAADEKMSPTLQEMADFECRSAVVEVMNEAVTAEMTRSPAAYTNLYAAQTDATGAIQTVQADAAALNQARLTLVGAVQQAVDALPDREISIPIGSLTGSALLNDLGPGWKLTLQPQGYVEGKIVEEAASVAINRVQYTATLELHVTINMVLDGCSSTAEVSTSIPIASLLIGGESPEYYSVES